MGDALIVAEKWNSALVVDNSLKICKCLIGSHALDRATNFEHRLKMNTLHNCLSLEAWNVFPERVRLAHRRLEKADQTAV